MHTHFDVFVEDISGKHLIDIVLNKILPQVGYTFKVHSYKGCGKLPENLSSSLDIRTTTL